MFFVKNDKSFSVNLYAILFRCRQEDTAVFMGWSYKIFDIFGVMVCLSTIYRMVCKVTDSLPKTLISSVLFFSFAAILSQIINHPFVSVHKSCCKSLSIKIIFKNKQHTNTFISYFSINVNLHHSKQSYSSK